MRAWFAQVATVHTTPSACTLCHACINKRAPVSVTCTHCGHMPVCVAHVYKFISAHTLQVVHNCLLSTSCVLCPLWMLGS